MASKKIFTPAQQQDMARAGLDYRYYVLVNDLSRSMLVKNLQTSEVLLVRKSQIPNRFGN